MIRLIISFITGFLIKTVDSSEEHGLKLNKNIKLIFSAAYGILLGYLISIAPLPGFWMGIIIGLVLSGKIDKEGHYTGVGLMLLTLAYLRFPVMNPVILIITALITIIEEWINDEVVDKKRVKGLLYEFLAVRPLLETTSIILSIYFIQPLIFLLLLSFDLGYLLSKKLLR